MRRRACGRAWVCLCLNLGACALLRVSCTSAICAALQLGYAASCKTYCYVYYLAPATTSFPFITPFLSLPSVFYCFFYQAWLMSLPLSFSPSSHFSFACLLLLFLSSHPFTVFLNFFLFSFFLWFISSSPHSLLPFFSPSHLPPVLPFLSSDFHPAATSLFSAFEHKMSLDLPVWSNLANVLSQTSVKTGMAAVCKICKSRISPTSWLAMSLCSYFRKSSLTINFSEVPDLDFNS